MVHLIDKDAIVAEIERRRDLHYKYYMENGAGSIAECKYDEDREILSFLNTLEVKEAKLDNHTIMEEIRKCGCNPSEFDVAKHFFELGMAASHKAQKGE